VARPETASGLGQTQVLIHTFLARFFENEATAGRTDLRESFFWLVAALAAPGMFFAFYEQFHWTLVAMGDDGAAQLRMYALFDKTLYLSLTAVAMGLVSAAVWNALVVDRRDALILGVLPVRRRAIVASKLLSLAAYVGALNLGVHTGPALLFGIFLGGPLGLKAVARGVAAHVIAASATGLFVFLSVVALQSACLAIVGPRRFGRAAAGLQMLLVALITTTLLATPTLCRGAVTLGGAAAPAPWLAYMPPIWFLGLYEALAGTSSSVMHGLARTGTLALGSAALAVVVAYPVACWRVLATASTAWNSNTRPWSRRVSALIVDRLGTAAVTRAALQFLLATAGRVGRFRLVLSVAVGLGLGLMAPVALYWIAHGFPNEPRVSLLAVPLLLTIPLIAGWRVVVAMPSELSARWVFRSTPMEGFAGRAAVRRLIFALGVVAPAVACAPLWVALWGLTTAGPFVVNGLVAGGILVEAHLWGFAGMPCSRPLTFSDSNLQGRWPFYGIGLLVYALGIPALEVLVAGHPLEWALTIGLVVAYGVARALSNDAARINVVTDDQRGLLVLDLAAATPPGRGVRPVGRASPERGVPREVPHA
jgi:hypothetical protein